MLAWESIQRAIDYIEENLTQELAIEELASVAALSPFYLARISKITNFSLRRENSKWSEKNNALVKCLEEKGLMNDWGRKKIEEA